MKYALALLLLAPTLGNACVQMRQVDLQLTILDHVLNSEAYGRQIANFMEKYPEEKLFGLGWPEGNVVRVRTSNNCYISSEVFFKAGERVGECWVLDKVTSKTQCAKR